MAIIVEDGSIVAGANSYVTRAEYIAYALERGIVIADAVDADVELIKAAQYIDSLERQLMGSRVTRDQGLAFPRYDVFIDDWNWAHTEIPRQVLLAQLGVALDIHAGLDPYNPATNLPVIEEQISGAVTVKYASPTSFKISSESTTAALIASLKKRGGLYSIPLVRA